MQTIRLGTAGLEVTDLCLGTMTFGSQTDAADGHRQIDMALEAGITFVDTAEMYPVNPVRKETVGRTEDIVGDWIAASGRRNEIVLATKITGANGGFCRDGQGITAQSVTEAIEGSLRRLRTDVIDLYQLHWPNRGSYHFRQSWSYDPSTQDRAAVEANMLEVLATLAELRDAGKIREIGLSNETAWGSATWQRLAGQSGGPRMVSIQNEYSLLCRLYDTDMAEVSANENLPLLAYSPLAAGLLTGKYRDGAVPQGSRLSINGDLGGRATPRAHAAVEAYAAVAEKHGLDLTHMSLAFCRARPFMGSIIFGATSATQLEHILKARDLVLSDEVLAELNAVHRDHPMPY